MIKYSQISGPSWRCASAHAGVREYWIIDPEYNKIHVYNMDSDSFVLSDYSFTDTVKAGIYEDLYIDFSSLNI